MPASRGPISLALRQFWVLRRKVAHLVALRIGHARPLIGFLAVQSVLLAQSSITTPGVLPFTDEAGRHEGTDRAFSSPPGCSGRRWSKRAFQCSGIQGSSFGLVQLGLIHGIVGAHATTPSLTAHFQP